MSDLFVHAKDISDHSYRHTFKKSGPDCKWYSHHMCQAVLHISNILPDIMDITFSCLAILRDISSSDNLNGIMLILQWLVSLHLKLLNEYSIFQRWK
jgi:hypothetical protein